MKAAFYTLGCKVNQYESQSMEQELSKKGFEIVDCDEKADVYVVNSCTVTAESDRKTRQSVCRLRKLHPDAVIVLTGCMPQAFPQDAQLLTQADIVTGNRSNGQIPELIDRFFAQRQRIVHIEPHEKDEKFSGPIVSDFRERTRATVKIEDGCNRFCSYCIIPYARGRVRSKPLEKIAEEIAALEKNGFCEIVLVGINLSAYGTDCGKTICDAVELAASFPKISRVRLGSLEPDHMTQEITDRLAKCKKLCPQFHISLQSGCDNTLKRMNRHYTSAEYEELCSRLRKSFADTTLTTDVMVGFAGETYDDFIESMDFVKKIGFEKVHVFPYSQRTGTRAAEFPNQIPKAEKENRSRMMIAAAKEIRDNFLEEQIGKTVSVLFEERLRDGTVQGYTANYTPVRISCTEMPHGISDVKIISRGDDWCIGELC
ncbi:MAG: tRNA (N(6)-L-threonylcarbamoyladenosine(37)-C(2))-methylthiotransferase MtaB [Clostridia bacterium]|nr:tRNA (N(6)-L-threonylcarbamoyladenosine(37)-C(2))-methylthiotransferase MtaB [Clostridia bacterium]